MVAAVTVVQHPRLVRSVRKICGIRKVHRRHACGERSRDVIRFRGVAKGGDLHNIGGQRLQTGQGHLLCHHYAVIGPSRVGGLLAAHDIAVAGSPNPGDDYIAVIVRSRTHHLRDHRTGRSVIHIDIVELGPRVIGAPHSLESELERGRVGRQRQRVCHPGCRGCHVRP